VAAFDGDGAIPGSALNLFQSTLEGGRVEDPERGAIFQVGGLTVAFEEPHTVHLGAFGVMRLPGVVDRVFHAHAPSIVLRPAGARVFGTDEPSRTFVQHASPYFSRSSILSWDFSPATFRRPGRLFRRVPWGILGPSFLSLQAVAAYPTQFWLAWFRSLPVQWFPSAEKLRRRWIGIDITHLAVGLIERRLKARYPDITFEIRGLPRDIEGLRELARQAQRHPRLYYELQYWAINQIPAAQHAQNQKKGADKGIDGMVWLRPTKGNYERVLISVKAGENVSVQMIRDLRGTVEREKSEARYLSGFGRAD
jgi:hypothetical protein